MTFEKVRSQDRGEGGADDSSEGVRDLSSAGDDELPKLNWRAAGDCFG